MGSYVLTGIVVAFICTYFQLVLSQNVINPTVNSAVLEIVDNATKTVVTTITDIEFVYLRYNVSGFGATISDLRACDVADCSNYNVQLIDAAGCPVSFGSFGKVIPTAFIRNSENTELYETEAFCPFRWDNGNSLFLKATRKICETSQTTCSNPCVARRKREVTPAVELSDRKGTFVLTGDNGIEARLIFSNVSYDEDIWYKLDGDSREANDKLMTYQQIQVDLTSRNSTRNFVDFLLDSEPIFEHSCEQTVSRLLRVLIPLSGISFIVATILTILRLSKSNS